MERAVINTDFDTDSLFHRLPVAVFRTTPDGRFLAANPALVELLGCSSLEDLLARDVNDFYVDKTHRGRLRTRFESGEAVPAEEIEIVTADRRRLWVRAWSRAIVEDGEITYYEGTLEDITDRRSAEDALRESEERFRTAFLDAPQGLALHDADGVPIMVNDALCEMVGLPRERIVGTPSLSFVHPEELADARDRIRRLREGTLDRWKTPRRIRRGDGTFADVIIYGAALRNEDGSLRGFMSQVFDVTEQKEIQRRLTDSEERFRQAFVHAPIGMAVTAGDGTRLRANPALCATLGVSEEEFLTTPLSDFLGDEDFEDAMRKLVAMQEGRLDAYHVERRLRRRDGSHAWARFSVSAVRDEHGNLRSVLTQIDDTTERRAALEALERRETEYRTLINAIPDMLFTLDRSGRILTFKPALEPNAAETPDDVVGRRIGELLPDAPELIDVIARALDFAHPQHIDIAVGSGDGAHLYDAAVAPLHEDEVIMLVRDITERVRAQEQLEELLRSKDELIASVSHELRTPLTTVVGLAAELRTRSGDFTEVEREELIELIAGQSTEMADLIDDLLVAARADVGMVHIEPEHLDLGQEAAGVVAAWQGNRPTLEVPVEPVKAWGDAFRIRQILRNLLSNAYRYGSEPVVVTVTELGEHGVISVADAGPALPPERWEQIFDPYARAHERRGVPASVGLGLTVSRQLARLMGGDLAYRAEGGHSFLELRLPAAPQN